MCTQVKSSVEVQQAGGKDPSMGWYVQKVDYLQSVNLIILAESKKNLTVGSQKFEAAVAEHVKG